MKNINIIFLGTGAADWPYHPSGEDRFDLQKKLRRTSSILINEHILVDPAPESFFFAKEVLKLDLSKLTDIFLTHSHEDHYNREALTQFVREARGKVNFYCHKQTIPFLELPAKIKDMIVVKPLQVQKQVKVGRLRIMPLAANHEIVETKETALHYEFEQQGNRILYGCDGGWFLAGTWNYLMGRELDAVIFDATVGDYEDDFRIASHNSIPMVRILVSAMKKNHVLNNDSRIVLSHFARTLHESITETEEKMKKEGMICAYDGMHL